MLLLLLLLPPPPLVLVLLLLLMLLLLLLVLPVLLQTWLMLLPLLVLPMLLEVLFLPSLATVASIAAHLGLLDVVQHAPIIVDAGRMCPPMKWVDVLQLARALMFQRVKV